MSATERHYHTPVHVLGMLSCAEEMSLALNDAELLAVWFHDAIYDTTASPGDNERQSADWMTEVLTAAGADAAIVHAAAQMIRWTACHLEPEIPPAFQTLLDLDLWGLSASPDIFGRQSTAVRSEMSHLGDEQYSRSTIGFFERLLQRPRLYRTDSFARFEKAARQQVTNEIRRLSKYIGGNGKH
jgi:predicted metal-dependent HD superfamily phosphohydrolase